MSMCAWGKGRAGTFSIEWKRKKGLLTEVFCGYACVYMHTSVCPRR